MLKKVIKGDKEGLYVRFTKEDIVKFDLKEGMVLDLSDIIYKDNDFLFADDELDDLLDDELKGGIET